MTITKEITYNKRKQFEIKNDNGETLYTIKQMTAGENNWGVYKHTDWQYNGNQAYMGKEYKGCATKKEVMAQFEAKFGKAQKVS